MCQKLGYNHLSRSDSNSDPKFKRKVSRNAVPRFDAFKHRSGEDSIHSLAGNLSPQAKGRDAVASIFLSVTI